MAGTSEAAALLAGVEQQRARVGDQRRIVGVDRIGVSVGRRLGEDDLGACSREQLTEGLVLGRDPGRVGLGAPAAHLPAVQILRARRAHQHAPELAGHRLAAVQLLLDAHAEDRTSASRRSRKARSAGCAASSRACP